MKTKDLEGEAGIKGVKADTVINESAEGYEKGACGSGSELCANALEEQILVPEGVKAELNHGWLTITTASC
jgi:hypothetical protein